MTKILAVAGLLAASFAFAEQAHADVASFVFNGLGISGSATVTYELNVSPPDPNPDCGTAGNNPCRADPVGAFRLTSIVGTFTDNNIGIVDAAITGLIPISPENERDTTFDPLVPASLSFIEAGLSYNNLFFPQGSPIDCDFPFSGTIFDVFGTAFTIAGGNTVNLWGDGNFLDNGGLTYGVGVASGATVLDYQFEGIDAQIVPEPATWSLMILSFAGLGFLARRRAQRTA